MLVVQICYKNNLGVKIFYYLNQMVIDKLSFGLKVWTLETRFEIQDHFFPCYEMMNLII